MDSNSNKAASANRWPGAASPPSGSGSGTGHGQSSTSQNAASRLTAPTSPGIATGPPWSHPPDFQQFPPAKAVHALSQNDTSDYRRNLSTSPTPSSSAAGPSRTGPGKSVKAPQTVADAVAASVGNKKERKRKRIHYSCAECHRRKHKCDRQYPCGPCLERGLGDSCRPFENGDEHGDYRDRITRLEDIVEALATAQTSLAKELTEARANGGLLPRSGDVSTEGAKGEAASLANSLKVADDDEDDEETTKESFRLRPPSMRGIEREELFHAERRTEGIDEDEDGRKVPGSAVESRRNPLEGGLSIEGDSYFGGLALPSVSRGAVETEINGERIELGAHLPRFPASFKIARLVSEGGAPSSIVSDLMALLPSKQVTDDLLALYFRDINATRLPFHEGTFRQSYDALMSFKWGRAKEEIGDDGARHIPFLSFLFIILAIAKRNEPESQATEEEAKKGSLKLYHACRQSLHVASFIRADHIDLVLAQLFAARFLITCRQSAESWSMLGSAIRAAQAIGLHRDGSKLGLDAGTTERRRRLWTLLFYQDKTTSILLGRPPAIQTHHCDTLPPSDVDVDTLPRTAAAGPARSLHEPGPPGIFAFVALRHALTIITGKIAEHFQNLSQLRSYSDVVKLDEELQHFIADMPAPYRTEETEGFDRSYDEICPWLPLHRYLINVEFHYVRCTLHRPYLLRNSEKYALSRNAAFASARADRRVRREYKRDVQWPKDRARPRHMGGLYRLFSSTLITGIELLLEPDSEDAAELVQVLDEFIEKHNRREEKDQCSKREVAIISLFKSKIKDPSWCARKAVKRARMAGRPAAAPRPSAEGQSNVTSQPGLFVPANSLAKSVSLPQQSGSILTSTGTPSAMAQPSSSTYNLAQTIFDSLGGGLEQFGINPGRSAGEHDLNTSSDGTTTFGGIDGPGLGLPDDLSGAGMPSATDFSAFWGGDFSSAAESTLTPGPSWSSFPNPSGNGTGNGGNGGNGNGASGSTTGHKGHGHPGSGSVGGAMESPASSGSGAGGNLANMDWSADSLMPWGAMIEAIALQKPGQGQGQGGGQGGGKS
ncbi:hypothetical protein BCV69DRAFT_265484 [Microstroma glucosiphilum]|uniref:Zn(2)-C6 fungal-type domain-containing protein n=1 Tax=Pseudomicrostroma glucosiphilum TaxID=1684307 RepID=A0A316UGH3_9BASI|nr:hypothetical protein BCV69DRAFT_265484 [Pseudomicrostroma glucosiphilum]PWN24038.1 hypothetical protein BCV69DRAFT_265484 [Pseudomicrostroma glucosiphilum]